MEDTKAVRSIPEWEKDFDEKFYPIATSEEMSEIVSDQYKTGLFWGRKATLEEVREYIRELLTTREAEVRGSVEGKWYLAIAHLTQEQREKVIATAKKIEEEFTISVTNPQETEI